LSPHEHVDEAARERIAEAVIAKVSTYEEDGRVRIPACPAHHRLLVGTPERERLRTVAELI
jgi:hypothetical protein